MSTITAVASDGISLIHLEGTGEGTVQSPFKPKHTLPDGAATAAGQNDIIAQLTDLNEALGATLTVDTTLEPLTDAQLRAQPVPVTGTVTLDSSSLTALENITVTVGAAVEINNDAGNPIPASVATLPLPDGAATAANQATIIGHIDGIETLLGGTLTVSTGLTPLTDAQLRAEPVSVSATVGQLPASLGQKVKAESTSVVLASDSDLNLTFDSTAFTFRDTGLSNTAVAIKSAAGDILGWNFINPNTVPVYIKFYNVAAGSVVVGTTAPFAVLFVPKGDATSPGVVYEKVDVTSAAYKLSTAISVAVVTGLADNSTTAPATAIYSEVFYR
jgi:hypothetical protein